MRTLDELPKPTIARVHGAAFGGGVGLVACCDIAIGAPEAKFGLTESKLGLLPAVISPYVIAAIGARQRVDGSRRRKSSTRPSAAHRLLHLVVASEQLDAAVQRQIDLLMKAAPWRPQRPRRWCAASPRLAIGDCRRCQRRTDRKDCGFRPKARKAFPLSSTNANLPGAHEGATHGRRQPTPSDRQHRRRRTAATTARLCLQADDAAQRFDARLGMVGTRLRRQVAGLQHHRRASRASVRSRSTTTWSTKRCSSCSKETASCASATPRIRCAPATSSRARRAARKRRTSSSTPATSN
jgi:enoyl-CoA hydratase/carnithine racemase